mmetsp:Transcript_12031/g.22081  ORF Transcript_12031/g.22081 Transcript_12031/m.22081 type:complete len:520 (-) Transcript_12031:149-1708(-)
MATASVAASAQAGIAQARDQGTGKVDGNFLKELMEARAVLKTTFMTGKTRTYEWRMGQLKAMLEGLTADFSILAEAMSKDLGRHEQESCIEFGSIISECKGCIQNLNRWMSPEKVGTPLLLLPGSSRIEKTPKGVVLIMGPWNFPANLTLIPIMQAIAAGNCVVLKPSEVARHTEAALAVFCEKYLDRSAVRVVRGGVAETTEILAQQWDHIFYTGNGAVGRIVMEAAAKHLTPVTLELGGKSPVIVDAGISDSLLRHAAERIMWTTAFMNSGQICVSPDTCLVVASEEKRLLQALRETMQKFKPEDYPGRLINQRHWDRVNQLAETSGGEKISMDTKMKDRDTCSFPATVISRPSPDSAIMKEEIFGPLLSVLPVKDMDEAIAYINARETPLALYIFSRNQATVNKVINSTRSGGVLVNDTFIHLGNPNLPFGGAGASGFGAYHGKAGFDEFSHRRSVLHKPLWPQVPFIYPPYDSSKAALVKRLQVGPMTTPTERGVILATLLGLGAGAGAMLRSRL